MKIVPKNFVLLHVNAHNLHRGAHCYIRNASKEKQSCFATYKAEKQKYQNTQVFDNVNISMKQHLSPEHAAKDLYFPSLTACLVSQLL